MTQNLHWQYLDNTQELAKTAASLILEEANKAITARGAFKLVLAGGSTPENAYRLLVNADTDWSKWHIYYGDERCLPPEHKDRNSKMAYDAFLQHTAIPENQIHPMPSEKGGEQAAADYQALVEKTLPFDLVLLGMGEDGHTASLFPGHIHNKEELAHAVYDAPKPPPERVSLSAKALSNAEKVIFLISANNKQQALEDWKQGEDLPVATICPPNPIEILLANG